MNIIIFHHFDYPEGMASTKRFQLFADYFQAKGCNVTILLKTKTVKTEIIETGIHNGIKFYKIHTPQKVKYPVYKNKIQLLKILELLESLFVENQRNVFLTSGLTPEFLAVVKFIPAKWELICDYVEDFTLKNSMYDGYIKHGLMRYLKANISFFFYKSKVIDAEKYMFKNAKGISAISPFLFKKASENNKNVISIPVTSNRLTKGIKNQDIRKTTLFFAGSGSLKDGLEILIKAFDEIASKHDVVLKISGKVADVGLKEIHQSKHPDKIEILGFLTDQEYYIQLVNADVLLMTRNNSAYSNAGFPFKIGEYLATGKPVITSSVSGIEMYLENRKNAFIVPPEKPDKLVEAIEYVIYNPEESRKIGLEGYKVFEECFLAETNCKNFYEFIVNLKH